MTTAKRHCRSPLGLLPDQPWPRLYDRTIEVSRARRYSRRREQACVPWARRHLLHSPRDTPMMTAAKTFSIVVFPLSMFMIVAGTLLACIFAFTDVPITSPVPFVRSDC